MSDSANEQLMATIDWDRDAPRAVHIDPEWTRRPDPARLLADVEEQMLARVAPSGDDVDLTSIPLERMGELADLLREARLEREALPERDVQRTATRHFECLWGSSGLGAINADMDWLETAPRQAVADELLEVLTAPEPPEIHQPAEDRLNRFLKEFTA